MNLRNGHRYSDVTVAWVCDLAEAALRNAQAGHRPGQPDLAVTESVQEIRRGVIPLRAPDQDQRDLDRLRVAIVTALTIT